MKSAGRRTYIEYIEQHLRDDNQQTKAMRITQTFNPLQVPFSTRPSFVWQMRLLQEVPGKQGGYNDLV